MTGSSRTRKGIIHSAIRRTSRLPARRAASPCPAAASRATASGMPEVAGAIQSIWALEASSSTPMASAPMTRDSQMRMTNPRARTSPLAHESTAVWCKSDRLFMLDGMRERGRT